MKLCSLLLLSLAIIGCAPPYIAELNSAAPLARQMTLIGTFGPLDNLGGSSTTSVKFLPVKPTAATVDALNVQSGFLVSRSPGMESLSFAFLDSGGNLQTSGYQPFPLGSADQTYPLYEYDVTATTTTGNILVYRLDGASIGNNSVQLFTASLPSGPFQSAPSLTTNPQYLNSIYGSQPGLAAQVLPLSSASDRFNFLFSNAGVGTEATAPLAASVTVFATGSLIRNVPTLPAGVNRFLYYRSQNDALSYLGYNSGGQWLWSRWDGSSFLPLPGVTHRIDALFTTGDLISTEGGTLRIYDSSGSQVLSVSLGALQFCYEAYVGTTPYVFFSLSMDLPRNSWAFRVYAIPTSALRGLSG